MITYTEKGHGLHVAVQAAGHSLEQRDGVWLSSDDAAVQAVIDGYTLESACAPIVVRIKELARRKILAILPEWKQSNCNARMNELNKIAITDGGWTQAQALEVGALESIWHRVNNIRLASDAQEQALRSLTSFADIAAFDIVAGWPDEA